MKDSVFVVCSLKLNLNLFSIGTFLETVISKFPNAIFLVVVSSLTFSSSSSYAML